MRKLSGVVAPGGDGYTKSRTGCKLASDITQKGANNTITVAANFGKLGGRWWGAEWLAEVRLTYNRTDRLLPLVCYRVGLLDAYRSGCLLYTSRCV